VHSIANETETPVDEAEAIRISANEQKWPNSPGRTARGRPDKLNGCGNHADRSSVYTDMPSTGYDMETAKDEAETISMHPMESKPPNPLTIGANGCANETDGSRNHPGTLNMRTHTITPANEAGNI
ncbi:hypothetical protein SCLCIDRAFT_1222784, partial [Scleroderma citrinum Foug A]